MGSTPPGLKIDYRYLRKEKAITHDFEELNIYKSKEFVLIFRFIKHVMDINVSGIL